MHFEALQWVRRYADTEPLVALEIGGRDINGTGRHLFPAATWTVLDIAEGPGVDVVADASTWVPDREYDLVLCTEVFEHTEVWPGIVATAAKALRPGGRLIITTAGPGRQPHSAFDGGALQAGEYYGNVEPSALQDVLFSAGFAGTIDVFGPDVRAAGVKHGARG